MIQRLDTEDKEEGREPLFISPSLQGALANMQDREFCNSAKWQEQQWRANRDACDPILLDFERRLINRMRNMYNVPMFCHCARRSASEQIAMVEAGFSKVSKGPHMYGLAVDIIHSTKAWGLSKMQWSLIGHVGKDIATGMKIYLDWGGDWSNPYDPAHWEVRGWRKRI